MMPRNPDNKRHTMSLRLPPDLMDRIDSEATKRILGRTKFVELLLVAALDRLEPPALQDKGGSDG